MNAEQIEKHLEVLAEAEGGVARLREVILQLAVMGSFVSPTNFGTESTAWRIVKLSSIALSMQNGISKRHASEGVPTVVLRLSDIRNHEISEANPRQVPLTTEECEKYRIEQGDILVVRVNGSADIVGRMTLCAKSRGWTYCDHFIRVRTNPDMVNPRYLALVSATPSFRSQVEKVTVTTAGQRTVNQKGIGDVQVPLPPLAAQEQIIAKVDELMSLCDELERRQQWRHSLRRSAYTAALDALTQAATPDELARAWDRLKQHWDMLATHPDVVPPLRQAILQLAVQGQLVRQDARDEPAEDLLRRISKEFLNDHRLTESLNATALPFHSPTGWAWTRFSRLGKFGRGRSRHRPRNDPALFKNGKYAFIQTGDVARASMLIKDYSQQYSEFGLSQSELWPAGTLCITIAANIAESAIVSFDACFPDSVVGLAPGEILNDLRFFLYVTKTIRKNLQKFAPSTAQKNINLSILEDVLVPVPPLPEQKRIVAKVDELMTLCDELERCAQWRQDLLSRAAQAAVSVMTSVQ